MRTSHPSDPGPEPELHAALAALEAARQRLDYDAGADQAARERYYEGVDQSDGPALYRELSELLERTTLGSLRQLYFDVDDAA